MQKFKVSVKGITPYMQHRMDDQKLEEWTKNRGHIIDNTGANNPTEAQGLYHSYITPTGEFYIPNEHFKQCFLNASKAVKGKVGAATKSMKQVVAGQFFVLPARIPFVRFDEVDVRSAVNRVVKARIMTKRPRWNEWKCEFVLEVHNDTISIETIKNIINHGGSFVGVGSYRPEHSGEFGRFETILEPIK